MQPASFWPGEFAVGGGCEHWLADGVELGAETVINYKRPAAKEAGAPAAKGTGGKKEGGGGAKRAGTPAKEKPPKPAKEVTQP